MQTCTRRIGEHVEHIEFGLVGFIESLERFPLTPVALPLLFNLAEIVLHKGINSIGYIYFEAAKLGIFGGALLLKKCYLRAHGKHG